MKKTNEIVVQYDDGMEQVEQLTRVRYTLIGSGELVFDPYLTQEQLVETTKTILRLIDHYGTEVRAKPHQKPRVQGLTGATLPQVFAVHSKGLGVVTQRELGAGRVRGLEMLR